MENLYLVLLHLVWLLVRDTGAACEDNWPTCPKKGMNTVCLRGENCGPTGGCKEWGADWQDFRKWMIDKHNELRQVVASGKDVRGGNSAVANMHTLSYDMDLEYVARCHINRCLFEHDKCKLTKKFNRFAGQNLYKGTAKLTTEQPIKRVVQLWYDEIENTTAEIIESYKSRSDVQIGHYTQVVWAETTHVGCAMSIDKDGIYYVACDYGPGGNIVTWPVYKRGKQCTACGKDKCNSQYNALCGEVHMNPSSHLAPYQLYPLLFIASIVFVVF